MNDWYALGARPSKSEDRGIALIPNSADIIFSPGISTGGFAEFRMVEGHPDRRVVATTIDERGLEFTKEVAQKLGFDSQVELKLEDLRDQWEYPDNHFDFIYARLVLHYLSAQDLDNTLRHFFSSLKKGGLIFVVVRSAASVNTSDLNTTFDPITRFTIRPRYAPDGTLEKESKRYFHTTTTITEHLSKAGFRIRTTDEYMERIYRDYARTDAALGNREEPLIEVVAEKP